MTTSQNTRPTDLFEPTTTANARPAMSAGPPGTPTAARPYGPCRRTGSYASSHPMASQQENTKA